MRICKELFFVKRDQVQIGANPLDFIYFFQILFWQSFWQWFCLGFLYTSVYFFRCSIFGSILKHLRFTVNLPVYCKGIRLVFIMSFRAYSSPFWAQLCGLKWCNPCKLHLALEKHLRTWNRHTTKLLWDSIDGDQIKTLLLLDKRYLSNIVGVAVRYPSLRSHLQNICKVDSAEYRAACAENLVGYHSEAQCPQWWPNYCGSPLSQPTI